MVQNIYKIGWCLVILIGLVICATPELESTSSSQQAPLVKEQTPDLVEPQVSDQEEQPEIHPVIIPQSPEAVPLPPYIVPASPLPQQLMNLQYVKPVPGALLGWR